MAVLTGDQLPRLESVPPYVNSRAADAFELAEIAGLYLDPWQKYVLTGALGVREDGKWSALNIGLIVCRQNGKGSILEARELAGLYLFKTDRLTIHTAHEHKTASEHYMRVWSLVSNTPELMKKVRRHSEAYGREFIELRPQPTIIIDAGGKWVQRNGAKRIIFLARTGSSGRGFTADLVVYDEDMVLDAGKVGSSMPSVLARPNPQIWFTGSAGLSTSTQEALIRRQGVAAINGERPVGRLAFYEWSINWHHEYCQPSCTEHDEPYTLRSLAKANPGLGIRVDQETLTDLRDSMGEIEYQRECLGVGSYPAPLDGWLVIPKTWYEATADASDKPPRVSHPVFAIDMPTDRSSAVIAVAGKRPDERVGVQVVEQHEGTGWVVKAAKRINDTWEPECWVIHHQSEAGSFIPNLEAAGLKIQKIQATDVAHACGLLYDAFRDNTLRHLNQDVLTKTVAAVDKRNISQNAWVFDRDNSGADISPLQAITLAYWGYDRFGIQEDYDARDSVHFDLNEIQRLWRAGALNAFDLQRYLDEGIITNADREELADAGIHF